MRPGLYAIVDIGALGTRDPLRFADDVLAAGSLSALQLRAKDVGSKEVFVLARTLAHRCKRADVPFFLNDRPDIAWLAGAAGVHLGQEDLSAGDARRVAPGMLVGLSTHSAAQLDAAIRERPEYVAFGPVFDTGSKRHADPTVGLESLRAVAASAQDTPVVAIGGITLANASSVRECGATSGAVIAALVSAPESELTERARALHLALGGR